MQQNLLKVRTAYLFS